MAFRVVIAGGGVAGIEAALALRALAPELVSVQLVSPEPEFAYRPLAVSEPFGHGHVHMVDLRRVASDIGAELEIAGLAGVDGAQAILDDGSRLEFDALVIATGTRLLAAVPGALTFAGIADVDPYRRLLEEIDAGDVGSVAFAVPHGVVWPLPLYELALMTARHPAKHRAALTVVTPEEAPLDVLGPAAARAVSDLLGEHDIALRTSVFPIALQDGRLTLAPEGAVEADRVVALPEQRGIEFEGVPTVAGGFIPVDEHGRVEGLRNVFAAGDITSYSVKQGGIAAQQADAVAQVIAAEAGAAILPEPFRPVLRSVLLTGNGPRYLSARIRNGNDLSSVATSQPFWSPADKIAAPFLAPYLARRIEGALR
ncbi:MAG TPA: FAD-dependent oxidoreductase [Gaiellales bacterium]|nr:FAD-dependent oxidoreductase [Gaiellales bacterium]